jgi:hypothetical protein
MIVASFVMRIDDFLRRENPDDFAESLGVPPVPEELTRMTILRYRGRLERYLDDVKAKLADPETETGVVLRLRRRLSKSQRRARNFASGRRRSWRYGADASPHVSATKVKKAVELHSRNRGRPIHMRETSPKDRARDDLRECRDTALALLNEIAKRFPNLPPEDKPVPKKRPLVAPEIDEFL